MLDCLIRTLLVEKSFGQDDNLLSIVSMVESNEFWGNPDLVDCL